MRNDGVQWISSAQGKLYTQYKFEYVNMAVIGYCEQYSFQKTSLGSPSVKLESWQNVLSLRWSVVLSARDLVQMDQSEIRYYSLSNDRCRGVGHKHIWKA